MTIKEDIAKIPRKLKNGTGGIKFVTSVYVDPAKLDAMRNIAKSHKVSISGIIELALAQAIRRY